MKKNNNEIIKIVANNIHQELSSLQEICLQIESLLKKAEELEEKEKTFYNRAAGSMLHDFYTGLEKIFCNIASKIDKNLPRGEDWHIKLLMSMSETKKNRPEVISLELMEELKEYLGFRHLFRNIYGMQLNREKLEQLLLKIQNKLWIDIKLSLNLFIKKLPMRQPMRKKRKFIAGFTLVELLIVIIIIGILAVMAVPQYQKMVEKAKWQGPKNMLFAIRNACLMFYQERGFYPVVGGVGHYLNSGVVDQNLVNSIVVDITQAGAGRYTYIVYDPIFWRNVLFVRAVYDKTGNGYTADDDIISVGLDGTIAGPDYH